MTGNGKGARGPRTVALVGPYASGKTTLLESILAVTGATTRKGSVSAGNSIGDSSPEARAHKMSTELNVATTQYLGESFTFLDCPGSVEFAQEALHALEGADAAVVVTEPDGAKARMLRPLLKHLSDHAIPHFIFVNKIDKAHGSIRELLGALAPVSDRKLVLRQVPIWKNEIVTGFIDLALDRAFVYREHAPSELIERPKEIDERFREARYEMLERLADYDDHLMEELLSDIEPPRDEVFADLARELAEGLIVPVLIGSAERDNGVRRLLKALRHEVPEVSRLAARAAKTLSEGTARIVKTMHTTGGKLSVARVLSGTIKDGATLYGSAGAEARIGGLFSMLGAKTTKINEAHAGDLVAFGRLEPMQTGVMVSLTRAGQAADAPPSLTPVHALALSVSDRKDDVKLSQALHKICEEDPSLTYVHHPETHELVLSGQGDIHLKVALERLANRFGIKLTSRPPRIPYRETIKKPVTQHARHKKQSGGHGQFGDITVEIKPLPRGSGIVFDERVTGGAVPKSFIPAIEKGVREAMHAGPLGFQVVDVGVTLTDGKYHDVDSSNEAFMITGRQAMHEGLPLCAPVLLEPVMAVKIHVPSDATSAVNGMVSSRRGHILGFDARDGWSGWDVVDAHIPESELHGLIVDLRSATLGVGTYTAVFDHLQELTGRPAEQALAAAKVA
ncbi:MAG TPA: elongation factor G [Micropepsaceae bacterium]|nr:elongation factor G [Micropepsaceae bacterium]